MMERNAGSAFAFGTSRLEWSDLEWSRTEDTALVSGPRPPRSSAKSGNYFPVREYLMREALEGNRIHDLGISLSIGRRRSLSQIFGLNPVLTTRREIAARDVMECAK